MVIRLLSKSELFVCLVGSMLDHHNGKFRPIQCAPEKTAVQATCEPVIVSFFNPAGRKTWLAPPPILILALAIAEYLIFGTEYIGKAMEATGTGPFFEWLQDLLHWQIPMPVW